MPSAETRAKNTPSQSFVLMAATSMPRYPISLVTVVHTLFELDVVTQTLQESNQGIHVGLAFQLRSSAVDVGIRIDGLGDRVERHHGHDFHGLHGSRYVHWLLCQPEVVRHDRLRHHFTRIAQV